MPKSSTQNQTTRRSMITGAAGAGIAAAVGCDKGGDPASRPPAAPGSTEGRGAARTQTEGATALQAVAMVQRAREKHWVGDGFPVSTVFAPNLVDAQLLSPFILMDHAEPYAFDPATKPRGVGEHPHRGFETVTFAYQGEVAHRDSHGGGGTIGAGGVQWMTAGSGVVHEEFHSELFTRTGGVFEMVQLWVNLPAKLKMTSPRYQALSPDVFVPISFGSAVKGRLLAGKINDENGPAATHSPITIFDVDFNAQGRSTFTMTPSTTTLLFVLRGAGKVQRSHDVKAGDLVIFDRDSRGSIEFVGEKGTRLLVLNGQPLNEPVVAHGPFVMNTKAEIQQAIIDYQKGLMGTLKPTT